MRSFRSPPRRTPSTAAHDADPRPERVVLGTWPRLAAQILRARLESAQVGAHVEWSGAGPDAFGRILVDPSEAEFASAVVHELDVDDEVPDTSPWAYVARLEEHLSAMTELLAELRTRLDELEAAPPPDRA